MHNGYKEIYRWWVYRRQPSMWYFKKTYPFITCSDNNKNFIWNKIIVKNKRSSK